MERLVIYEQFGPIKKTPFVGIRLYPFTLLMGKDGIGSTLFLRMVHFFRNRRWVLFQSLLSSPYKIKRREDVVLRALTRVYRQAMASGIVSFPIGLQYASDKKIGIEVDKRLNVHLSADFAEEVDEIMCSVYGSNEFLPPPPLPSAAYIPADRSDIPALNFSHVIKDACKLAKTWENGEPDSLGGKWIRRAVRQTLGGEMYWNKRWVWRHGDIQLPINALPAGQRYAWPIICLSEAMFTWRERNEISPDFALHIEEPEAHLYSEAQGAVVYSLAYLVNSGFRVLAYTHSLLVLYLMNNLIAASDIPKEYNEPGLPPPEVRLGKWSAGGYYLEDSGEIKDLVDRETGLVSEEELAKYGEELIVMANRIDVVSAYWPNV